MAFVNSFTGPALARSSPIAPLCDSHTAPTGVVMMAAPWNEALRQSATKQYVSFAAAGLGGGSPATLTNYSPGKYAFKPAVSGFPKKNIPALSFEDVAGGPTKSKADDFMAASITAQYKAVSGTNNGVYLPQCTEATIRGDAENARVLALGAEFRRGQRSISAKYNSLYDIRAKATAACNGCSYEEKLVSKFPRTAYAMVKAGQEAKGTCIRYARPETPEEAFMTTCIDRQMMRMSASSGVFGCYDGSTPELVERSRVLGLAKNFTTGWMSSLRKEQIKYDSRKHAEAMVGHECDAEAVLFAMPAIAQAMRPMSTHLA